MDTPYTVVMTNRAPEALKKDKTKLEVAKRGRTDPKSSAQIAPKTSCHDKESRPTKIQKQFNKKRPLSSQQDQSKTQAHLRRSKFTKNTLK